MNATDLYPHLIGLRFAITELLSEMAVDTIRENPRTVMLALQGLEAKAEKLVGMAASLETRVEAVAYPHDATVVTAIAPWCTETGQNACSCHERDGSKVCEFCRLQGHRGHCE